MQACFDALQDPNVVWVNYRRGNIQLPWDRIKDELERNGEMAAPWPEAMPPALAKILGMICFEFKDIATVLRAGGRSIARKAEAEQAAGMHWLIGLWFKHGDGWVDAANAEIQTIRDRLRAQQDGANG